MFKRVPGTKDILPEHIQFWHAIEEISRATFSLYNYSEIRPPLIEEAALFNRSLGDAAEIVRKQMFVIQRDEDLYALRPEATASVVRAYVENSLDKTHGFVKLYYMGPMFRAERPQKGRLRQFHHIGCEAIASYGPDIDVEMISLADTLLKAYGIRGYRIVINSLGCSQDKQQFNAFLRDRLKDKIPMLCEDCRDRYERNILRVLDCKNEGCQHIIKALDLSGSHRCTDCNSHFDFVKKGLERLGVAYEVSHTLVRGLDYYNRTVFEFKHDGLGPQQDALGAGGRYDGLVKELGGEDAGAIGFAFGFERLLLALGAETKPPIPLEVYLIALGDAARQEGPKILSLLRQAGIRADTDYQNRSLKAAMRKANDLAARYVALLGDDELKDASVTLKKMSDSAQQKVRVSDLVAFLRT